MPNALTGDFDAVLQVSGSTLDRLMATIHQNAYTNPNLPSFPHSLQFRIGGANEIDGVRGIVQLQIGVPRLDLINGSTSRFGLDVGIRAWFQPDYNSTPFPVFIDGTVHAEYELADIDPHCMGWSHNATDYLWIRVIPNSVKFTGTADDDTRPIDFLVQQLVGNAGPTNTATIEKVQRQIAAQLATNFAATPHPVSKNFQRGSMLTLNGPNGTALATALALNGNPSGNIASVNNVFLGGADMAVGVSIDFVMSAITPALDPIKNFSTSVSVTWNPVGPFLASALHTTYRSVRLQSIGYRQTQPPPSGLPSMVVLPPSQSSPAPPSQSFRMWCCPSIRPAVR